MLTEDEVEALEAILFAPEYGDHALDVFGLHGAVTAAVISPEPLDVGQVFAVATGQAPETVSSVPEAFSRLVTHMAQHLRQMLEQGHSAELPQPEDEDSEEEAVENWCAGFTDVFLLEEDQWLASDEEEIGQLVTPILTLSNLFDDEAFQQARQDPKRYSDYSEAIPDILTDLYLHFHSP